MISAMAKRSDSEALRELLLYTTADERPDDIIKVEYMFYTWKLSPLQWCARQNRKEANGSLILIIYIQAFISTTLPMFRWTLTV